MTDWEIVLLLTGFALGLLCGWGFCLQCGRAMVMRKNKELIKKC